MTASSAITAIGPGKRIEFSTGKMPAASTTMSAFAKDPYLVNKVCFLHNEICGAKVMVLDLVIAEAGCVLYYRSTGSARINPIIL